MFEFVEETLDEVALFVEFGVIGTLDLAVSLGGNDDLSPGFGDPVDEVVGIVSLVGQGGLGLEAVDERVGEGDIVALAGRADQPNRIAERVAGGVDLGAQSTSRPAQTLGIRPPFCLRAPAAC